MMTDLVEMDVGTDGIAYIQQALRQAEGLSNRLLGLPLTTGKAYALVPPHVSLDRAKSFDEGGLIAPNKMTRSLTERLPTLWEREGSGTFVLQDVWAKPGDSAVQRTRARKFFAEAQVYYFVGREDAQPSSVEKLIRAIASHLLVGISASFVVRDNELPPDRVVERDVVDALAQSTIEVFVSAYDRESFIVWRRE